MAELASGAVSSLLGLLRNEALLLSNVGSDMEFIKEEMESMQSFLEHLARTARPAGGHDEQVRTWMKQVRDLARDCSNFIELHHRRGDLAVYRARGRRWRYLWWADWLVHKMVAQHSAATRLRELKERARDVGKRRLRYGVEIPRNHAVAVGAGAGGGGGGTADAASSMLLWPSHATAALAAAEEEDDDNDEEDKAAEAAGTDGPNPRRIALEEPRVLLEDYCAEKLASWLELQSKTKEVAIASTAIVAPDDAENAGAIARESLNLAISHFTRKVWINLPDLHLPWDLPLLPSEILAYILRECEIQEQEKMQQQAEEVVQDNKKVEDQDPDPRQRANRYKNNLIGEIWGMIKIGNINVKIQNILKKIGEVDSNEFEGSSKNLITSMTDKRLGVLLHVLRLLQKIPDTGSPLSWDAAMEETASRLKTHMEQEVETKPTSNMEREVKAKPQICLHVTQYKDILKKLFAESNNPQPQAKEASTSTSSTATTLGEDHIKEIINNHRITLNIIWELLPKQQQQQLEGNSGTGSIQQQQSGHDQVANSTATAAETVIKQTREKMKDISGEAAKASGAVATAINETKRKLSNIIGEIIGQMLNKGVVDMINKHLEDEKTLIILQDDDKDFVSRRWEDTRYALNLLGCAAGSAVIVSTKNSQKAKEFCNPPGEPVTCSLVGLYHDIVLQLTEQRVNNGNDGYNSQILHDILDSCHPHEFCMKIFAHALFANPNRSYQELCKLHQDLVPQMTLGSKAKKILKFSYKELPREYKTCLLYLAIFPQGHNIRRSTLIGRWVTEGLITKQDWRTTVRHAERCFDALIKRGLVLPHDIDATGKVKSCIVGDQVHRFITKMANKEHILDARLADQWARHFSIFSGLRLRASDRIEKFVQRLPKYSPQLPLLKVLDLEGINCFEKNQYLKDICNKILLLKYLSLRRTNVTKLPIEINNLHELEVLDIRQTRVPENATRNVLLLKLRRLLADRVDSSSGMCAKPCSAVQIPNQIDRMENLEVLSNVKASGDGSDLKKIRNLWQLRKLGVVIEDNYNHLRRLFRAISDLHECLLSLSVTISPFTETKKVSSSEKRLLQENIKIWRKNTRKLESLTINEVTHTENVQLLESLAKGCDDLAKVTLSSTLLEQKSLMVLAMLPKLHSVRLRCTAYSETKLTFNKEEFPQLKYFLVEGPDMTDGKTSMTGTDIKFEDGATTELEKIVLSFTNIRSLCGIDNLPKLKELELEANQFLLSFSHEEAAPKQQTENKDDEQNTQNGDPDKNSESRALGHNTQDQQSTKSRAAAEQGTQSRAPEQSTESTAAAEQYTQNRAPEQSTESRAAADQDVEKSTQSKGTEQKARSRVPNQNTNTRAAEQNTVPKQNTESRFTFKKDKFQHLVCFRFKDSKMTNIIFEPGAAPELKKIALTLDDTSSTLTGINGLPKLKEVELKGDKFLLKFFDQTYRISMMTLQDTHLKQEDIHKLGKKPNLHCLVLSDKSYDESQLTFNKDEFPKLDLLIVECRNIDSISFTDKSAAPKLERIVWSFSEMKSLSGISNLLKLKEIECSGEHVPYQVRKDITAHKGKPVLTHKRPLQKGQAKETSTGEEGDDTGSPLISRFLKIKSRG
ncbi:uncharacterized protein LOC8067252 [Sorghum bicolor]|nr:uncharacterized protein LOC8067252 [Sorghum bicolor]|eukprot:XP_021321760.1 uncharacterized protein LOC8067252 [Sorghum bicolor]